MASLSDYTRTGRQQLGSGSDLFEMRRADGALFTAIQFHPEYRGHNAINSALTVVLGFLESPMVSGLADLVARDLSASTFLYATGQAWSVAEVVRTMADMGSPGSVRAGVELMRAAGNILVEATEAGEGAGIYSHGGITPWRLMLDPEGRVQIVGFALPQVEILAFHEHPDRVPREDAFRYCPPERMEAKKENFSSDLFGLALVAFELMTGRPIYDGLVNDIRSKAARGETTRRLHQFREVLAPGVHQLLSGALRPEIRDRYGSGQEFLDAVEVALADPGLTGPSLRDLMQQVSRFQPRARQTLVDANKTAALSQADRLKVLEEGLAEAAPTPARRTVSIPTRSGAATPATPAPAAPTPVSPPTPAASPAFAPTASPLDVLRASRAGPPRRAPSAEAAAAASAAPLPPPTPVTPPRVTSPPPASSPPPAASSPATPPAPTGEPGRWGPPQRVRANPRAAAAEPEVIEAPRTVEPTRPPETRPAEARPPEARVSEPPSRPPIGTARPSPRRVAEEARAAEPAPDSRPGDSRPPEPRPAESRPPEPRLAEPPVLTSSADRASDLLARLRQTPTPARPAPSASELIDRVLSSSTTSRRLHDDVERMMAGQPASTPAGPAPLPPPPSLPPPPVVVPEPPAPPAPPVVPLSPAPPPAVQPVFVPPTATSPAAPERAPGPGPAVVPLKPPPSVSNPIVPLSPPPVVTPLSPPPVAAPVTPTAPPPIAAPSAPPPIAAPSAPAAPPANNPTLNPNNSGSTPAPATPSVLTRSGGRPVRPRVPDPVRSFARGEPLPFNCARAPGISPQRHRMPGQTPLAEVAGMLVGRFVPARITPDGRFAGWYRVGNTAGPLSPDLRVDQLSPDETYSMIPVDGRVIVLDVEVVAENILRLRLPLHTALPVASLVDGLAAMMDLPAGDWTLSLDGNQLGAWHILEDRPVSSGSVVQIRRV